MAEAAGPVTLEQARELAGVSRPKRAISAARETAGVPAEAPSIREVGEQREKLREEQREERARRIDDYKAVMDIMKARGALPPGKRGAGGRETAAESGESFEPLRIFAEGDSWFDYPVPLFGGGIVPRLENLLGVPILNLAKAGDEVRYMLGVEERKVMIEHLSNGSPSGDPWDVLLFSGGGNDIVDNPMALWVKDWNPALPPAGQINQPRFDAALVLVRAGYEDLITLRNQLSPDTVLVFHGYDFAIPDGRGVCSFGPWLKPTFDLRKFPTIAAGQAVVRVMLEQFEKMLVSLSGPKAIVMPTQGVLVPQTASWANELHPAKAGFQQFAQLYHDKLKAMFPARVA
ncbi:hypothetical protein [Bradyrhizobium sp. LTSP885]|uniref:hypothetical protein n=1 Tax=Bradyrhizobium sp. LTSP885 TaxID=1619232 RepID=UPI0012E0033C|nr:hypothetical protein [Bradyrhizobium sp. LTSP885]